MRFSVNGTDIAEYDNDWVCNVPDVKYSHERIQRRSFRKTGKKCVKKPLSKTPVSAIKWSFVKRFDSTADCLAHLEKNNFTSIVTSPHTKGRKNVVLHEGDYTAHHKLAVWFGSESRGVSDLAVKRSALCVNMPMLGMIESLNLGTTSGIVLYEITKQRREYQRMYKRKDKRGRKFIA